MYKHALAGRRLARPGSSLLAVALSKNYDVSSDAGCCLPCRDYTSKRTRLVYVYRYTVN